MEKENDYIVPRSVNFERKVGSILVSRIFPLVLNGNEIAKKYSKINVILTFLVVAIYLYASMMPTTLKSFRNNYKNGVSGDFLGQSKLLKLLFIVDCDMPTQVLRSPSFYIIGIFFFLYLIYFFTAIFKQKYLQNKFMQRFLFVMSGPVPTIPFILGFTNSCFGIYFFTPSTNVYRWMFLIPMILFILMLFGILLAITYSSFTIKHGQALAVVSPKCFFSFIAATNVVGGFKIFLLSEEFENRMQRSTITLVLALVCVLITYFTVSRPFVCSKTKKILFLTTSFSITGNSVLALFGIFFEDMSCMLHEILSIVIVFVSLVAAILTGKISLEKAKRFDVNDVFKNEELTEQELIDGLMYKDLYEQYKITDEVVHEIFDKWPRVGKLHFYVVHLITTDKSKRKAYSRFFTALEQHCYGSQSKFDILHLLVVMEYASKNDDNDTSSYARRKFLALVEKARDCQNFFWRFILNGMPTAASKIYPTIGKLTDEIEGFYAQIPEDERKSDFYSILYITHTAFVSLDLKNIDNVYVDFTSDDAFEHCFLTNDDGTITRSYDSEGKEKILLNLKGKEYAERVFEHNDKFAVKEDVEKCNAVDKKTDSFLLIERIAASSLFFLGLLFSLCFSFNMFYTYGKVSSAKVFSFSTLGDLYAFIDVLFWTIFDATTTGREGENIAAVYANEYNAMKESILRTINEIEDYQSKDLNANLKEVFNITEYIMKDNVIGEITLDDFVQRDDYMQFTRSLITVSCIVLNKTHDRVEAFRDNLDRCQDFGHKFGAVFIVFFVVGTILMIIVSIFLYKKIGFITIQSLLVDKIELANVFRVFTSLKRRFSKKTKLSEATAIPLETIAAIEIVGYFILAGAIVLCLSFFQLTLLKRVFSLYYDSADARAMPSVMTPTMLDYGVYMYNKKVPYFFRYWIKYCYYNGITLLGDSNFDYDYVFEDPTTLDISYSFHYIAWRDFIIASDDNISMKYKAKLKAFAESLYDTISVIIKKPVQMPRTAFRRSFFGLNDTGNFLVQSNYTKEWCSTLYTITIIFSIIAVIIVVVLYGIGASVPLAHFWKIRQLMKLIMVLPRKTRFFSRNEDGEMQADIVKPPFSSFQDVMMKEVPVCICTTNNKGEVTFANRKSYETFGDDNTLVSIFNSAPRAEYVLPSGEKKIFYVKRSPFMIDKKRTRIPGSWKIIIEDITEIERTNALLKQEEKNLAELKNEAFPLYLYNQKDSCNFIDGMTVVDIVFDHSHPLTDDQFESFAYEAKYYAEQESTFFISNRTQWSFFFVFTNYGTLSIENQHYKDAIEFTRNILLMRHDVKVGIVKTRKAFLIANVTRCPGILILSAAPDIAHAITKKQPIGSICIDTTVIENYIDEREINIQEYFKEKNIYGCQFEYCVFPNRSVFEEILF